MELNHINLVCVSAYVYMYSHMYTYNVNEVIVDMLKQH